MTHTANVLSSPSSPNQDHATGAARLPSRAPMAPNESALPVPPRALWLIAADGFRIAAREYAPDRVPARASVVLHGATAVPQNYYARFASALAATGLRVLTYDYRGVGASRPESLRGFEASMVDWAALDARAAIAHARTAKLPLVSIGHSFGGQLLGLIDEALDVDAAVFVGAQFGYVGHWPPLSRARLEVLLRVAIPALTATFGELPGWSGIGTSLPAGVARQWARWCTSPAYLASEFPEAHERLARFRAPALFYSFTDDEFAPRAAVEHLLGRLGGRPLHRRLRPAALDAGAIGHFGFFRPRFAGSLWRETSAFIDHALDGTPLPAELRGEPCADPCFHIDEIEADLRYGRG